MISLRRWVVGVSAGGALLAGSAAVLPAQDGEAVRRATILRFHALIEAQKQTIPAGVVISTGATYFDRTGAGAASRFVNTGRRGADEIFIPSESRNVGRIAESATATVYEGFYREAFAGEGGKLDRVSLDLYKPTTGKGLQRNGLRKAGLPDATVRHSFVEIESPLGYTSSGAGPITVQSTLVTGTFFDMFDGGPTSHLLRAHDISSTTAGSLETFTIRTIPVSVDGLRQEALITFDHALGGSLVSMKIRNRNENTGKSQHETSITCTYSVHESPDAPNLRYVMSGFEANHLIAQGPGGDLVFQRGSEYTFDGTTITRREEPVPAWYTEVVEANPHLK